MPRIAILRHAPALTDGRVAGRRDVEADCSDDASFGQMRANILRLFEGAYRVVSSPARRCLQTAEAMGLTPSQLETAFWEQDQGQWEGQRYADLPDLGPLTNAALARHRAPGGESFTEMSARVAPALSALVEDTLIIAHAGTVRAALSLVVGYAALSFDVAPLSLTVLTHRDRIWSVDAVNLTVES